MKAFSEAGLRLPTQNDDFDIGSGRHTTEFLWFLSDRYCITISPLIEGGELSIFARATRMNDNHGTCSQDFDTQWEKEIRCQAEDGLEQVVSRTAEDAKELYVELLQDVGISERHSLAIAEMEWKKANRVSNSTDVLDVATSVLWQVVPDVALAKPMRMLRDYITRS